jgi:hypothetical protein
MIIVQDTFVCKPGNASKLAKLFKEWADVRPKERDTKIMTDMTGQWHRVVVSEWHRVVVSGTWENLTDYEDELKNMMERMSAEEKAMMDKFKDMNEMYVSGSREIFKLW